MEGILSRSFWTALFVGLTVSTTGCVCFPTHCNKEEAAVDVPSVLVSGMVTKPGFLPIPKNGLTIRDALALANGENPLTEFNISPIYLLVSIERANASYHFALPLVTNNDAGKVLLMRGDRVVVHPWYETDLARLSHAGSITTGENVPQILLPESSIKLLPVFGITDPSVQKFDFKVQTSALGANGQEVTQTYDFTDPLNPAIATVSSVFEATKLVSSYSPAQTVCVLKRVSGGQLSEYVLLRTEPSFVQNDGQNRVGEILEKIVLLPRDSISVDVLQRMPIVLSSMLAPHLFKPVIHKPKNELQECLPGVYKACDETKQFVHTLLKPVHQLFGDAEAVVGPSAQSVGEAVMTPFQE
jgi:hypothetical protein